MCCRGRQAQSEFASERLDLAQPVDWEIKNGAGSVSVVGPGMVGRLSHKVRFKFVARTLRPRVPDLLGKYDFQAFHYPNDSALLPN